MMMQSSEGVQMGGKWMTTLILAIFCTALHAQASKIKPDPRVPSDEALQAELVRQETAATGKEPDRKRQIMALEAEYKQKLEANKDDQLQRFYYANFLGLIGRQDDAKGELDRIIDKAPGFVPAYHRLAVYYKHKGLHDRARQELNRALEIDANHYDSNLMLADYHMDSANSVEAAQAETLLRRILKVRARSRTAHYRLGKLLYDRGYALQEEGKATEAKKALNEAVVHFNDVVVGSPDAVDLTAGLNYFWLAHSYYHLGNKEDAYSSFRLAVRILPPSKEKERALRNIAALAAELGLDPLWDSLRNEIRRSLDQHTDSPDQDLDERYKGAVTLCNYFRKVQNPEALSIMIEVLEKPHEDLQVRVLVARSIGIAGLPDDLKKQIGGVLTKTLGRDKNDLVKASAAYGLAELAWKDAMPALIRALDSGDEYLFGEVLSATETLANTRRPSLVVVPDGAAATLFAERKKVQSSWQQWWENGGKK